MPHRSLGTRWEECVGTESRCCSQQPWDQMHAPLPTSCVTPCLFLTCLHFLKKNVKTCLFSFILKGERQRERGFPSTVPLTQVPVIAGVEAGGSQEPGARCVSHRVAGTHVLAPSLAACPGSWLSSRGGPHNLGCRHPKQHLMAVPVAHPGFLCLLGLGSLIPSHTDCRRWREVVT